MTRTKALRQYAVEYSLVVLGVLTAAAIEHWRETRHQKELATQASAAIQTELRDELAEVKHVLDANSANVKIVEGFYDDLLAKVNANAPKKEYEPAVRGFFANIQMKAPDFHRDAWEAALASQAVVYLEPAKGRRYAAAYDRIRDVHDRYLNRQESMWDAWTSAGVDAETGHLDPIAFLKAMRSYIVLVDDFDAFLGNLARQLEVTLDAK